MREKIIDEVLNQKIIAIVRGADKHQALEAARALCEGGVNFVEVTFNQREPQSFIETANAISLIREKLGDKMFVGAGTVTSAELVNIASSAGAQYIISPDTDPEVIFATREKELVSMPGAYTPSEAKIAHKSGADFVKLFPCVGNAPEYVKAICAPFNHIRFLAVGGVNISNAADFLKAGAVGLGVGSSLVSKKDLDAGAYEEITKKARQFVAAIK